MSKIKLITINIRQRIPYLNVLGPIVNPVSVTEAIYERLCALGFPVVVHKNKTDRPKPETILPPTYAAKKSLIEKIKNRDNAAVVQDVTGVEKIETEDTVKSSISPNITVVPTNLQSTEALEIKDESTTVVIEEALEETTDSIDEVEVEEALVEVEEALVEVEESEEVLAEEVLAEEVEEPEEIEEYTDFVDGENNLLIHTYTEYKTWKKEKLIAYLTVAKDFLTDAEFNSIESLTKTKMLTLIKLKLIDA